MFLDWTCCTTMMDMKWFHTRAGDRVADTNVTLVQKDKMIHDNTI